MVLAPFTSPRFKVMLTMMWFALELFVNYHNKNIRTTQESPLRGSCVAMMFCGQPSAACEGRRLIWCLLREGATALHHSSFRTDLKEEWMESNAVLLGRNTGTRAADAELFSLCEEELGGTRLDQLAAEGLQEAPPRPRPPRPPLVPQLAEQLVEVLNMTAPCSTVGHGRGGRSRALFATFHTLPCS